jgi:hypothetical protein
MRRLILLPLVACISAISLAVAVALESVYDISIRPRPPEPLLAVTAGLAQTAVLRAPLELRLVDSAGVGIPTVVRLLHRFSAMVAPR